MSTSVGGHHGASQGLGAVVRGLGALILLTVLVAGVPVILWITGGSPLPASTPDLDKIWRTVSSPDDGTFFLDVMIVAGWVGWATFAASVLVEIPAAVRGVTAPRLPGLGAQQRLVAGLIAAVATVVPTSQVAAADAQPGTPADVSVSGPAHEDSPVLPAPPVTKDLLEQHGASVSTAPPAAEPSAPYEVVAGDTLWDIAADQLGDPTRYPEIAEASARSVQDDGRHLTDPDLIYPGWELTIPGTTGADAPAGGSALEAARPTIPGQAPSQVPDRVADSGSESAKGPSTTTDIDAADDDTPGILRTAGGVGVVLATGLVGVLATRRAARQRRRRAGEHLIADSSATLTAELEIRQAADPAGVEFVDRALRSLAMSLTYLDRPLPALRAARLLPDRLELYLDVPAPLPDPFVGTADHDLWTVSRREPSLTDATTTRDQPAPYPSLVTLGHDTEDGHLLVDLEYVGALAIQGDHHLIRPLMTAMAAEYATTRWADDIRVTLVGGADWVDLDILETGRVRHVADIERLLDELMVRTIDDRQLLAEAGASDVTRARVNQVADPTWTPEILLVADALTADQQRRLTTLATGTPKVAIAAALNVVTPVRGWALRLDGPHASPTAVLDPVGMTIRPQLLTTRTYQDILNLLRTCDHGTAGRARPEPDLRDLPALPTTGHPGFEPLLPDNVPVRPHPVEPTANAVSRTAAPAAPLVPRLIMLGPVEVVDAAELGERNKLGQLTELAMFIAMTPGCDTQAIDEAIWPGSVVTKTTRNTAISKLRRWLGTDESGAARLPRTEGHYTFLPDIRSDWQDWCDLLPEGPEAATTPNLRAALDLVRGRPFSGRGRRKYAWVDHHAQDMIVAIVDACHELAIRSLADGTPREALRAALLGLSVEPGVELLWRDRLKAEVMIGDRATVLASVDMLRSTADDLGGDLDDDTERLIDQILEHGHSVGVVS